MSKKDFNEFFQAVVSTLPDVLVFFNNEGRFLQIWTGREENLYLPKEALIGRKVNEVLPEKVGKKIYKNLSKCLKTSGFQTIEFELEVLSGQKFFEARLVSTAGNRVLMVARNITNRKEAKSKIEELHQVAIKLAECDDREDIYSYTVEAAENVLEFDVCTLDIVKGEEFIVKATSSGELADKSESSSIYEGISGECYRKNQSMIIDDIYADKEAKPVDDSFRSALTVPIGELGIFQVISTRPGDFDDEDLKLTELLISHTYTALKRIEAKEEIRYLGFHDELTGLYNRKYIEEELERLDTCRQLPISIIMGDINGLKLVNDAFGHKEGDKLLQKIANIIKETCRQEDILGRFGGDEFIIVLPQTDSEEAETIVERINNNCQESWQGKIPLSISLGSSTKKKPEEDLDEIIKQADDSMYDRKLKESKKTKQLILERMIEHLGNREKEIQNHARRVQELSFKLGRKLGLPSSELGKLSQAAYLHDIGLITLSDEVINKLSKIFKINFVNNNFLLDKSNLDLDNLMAQNDWEEIKKHPAVGYRIVRSSERYAHLAEPILYHHEKWNGSGYPRNLEGKDIPLLARIINLVDAYDILMEGEELNDNGMSQEEAISVIKNRAGELFDPELVDKLVEII